MSNDESVRHQEKQVEITGNQMGKSLATLVLAVGTVVFGLGLFGGTTAAPLVIAGAILISGATIALAIILSRNL